MEETKHCPLQRGFGRCATYCAWYDALYRRCELVNMAETLLDISETLENFHAAQAEDNNDA